MNRSHLCRSFAVFLLLSAPFAASALTLPGLPAGMCPLDENVEAERVVLDYLKSANEGTSDVLAVFGDCAELRDLKAGNRQGISHYGTVLRQTQLGKLSLTRENYLATTAALYANDNGILADALGQAQDITGSATRESGLTAPEKMGANSKGVLYHDKDIVVMGVEQTQQLSGKKITVASTVGLTLIEGDPISVNLYAPAREKDGENRTIGTLKRYIAKLIAVNPR